MLLTKQLRRERFAEDLESYGRQVEEFVTYGDMAEIPKYLKKAQALDNKLQTASDKVQKQYVFQDFEFGGVYSLAVNIYYITFVSTHAAV